MLWEKDVSLLTNWACFLFALRSLVSGSFINEKLLSSTLCSMSKTKKWKSNKQCDQISHLRPDRCFYSRGKSLIILWMGKFNNQRSPLLSRIMSDSGQLSHRRALNPCKLIWVVKRKQLYSAEWFSMQFSPPVVMFSLDPYGKKHTLHILLYKNTIYYSL